MYPILGIKSTAHEGQPAVSVDFDLKTLRGIKAQTLGQDRRWIHASMNTSHEPSTRQAGHTDQNVLSGSSGGQRSCKLDRTRPQANPGVITGGNQHRGHLR